MCTITVEGTQYLVVKAVFVPGPAGASQASVSTAGGSRVAGQANTSGGVATGSQVVAAGTTVQGTGAIIDSNGNEVCSMSTSAVNVNANGLAPVRADARYLRARVKVTGGFQRAIGFDIDAVRSGKR